MKPEPGDYSPGHPFSIGLQTAVSMLGFTPTVNAFLGLWVISVLS